MRPKKNAALEARIAEAWKTGRYKSYSSLARVFKVYPKLVARAVKNGKK